MKFIWNEPTKIESPYYPYPKLHWQEAVVGWLRYNGVWPIRDNDHWVCDYNYIYHFFDITIFECWLTGHGAPDHTIKAMQNYLKNSNLSWKESNTWTWDNGKERPGKRFWIYAEDYLTPESV